MSKKVMALLLITMVAVPLLEKTTIGVSAPIPTSESNRKKTLERLKKQLPAIINGWLREETGFLEKDANVMIELIRPLSEMDVKMTICYKTSSRITAAPGVSSDDSLLLTVHLRYYDDNWTVMTFHSNDKQCDVLRLISLIDRAGKKEI